MQFADPKNDIALKESDEINALRTAEKKGLERGIEKGLEKGMQKGLEKGMQKGLEKGLEDGKNKEKINIAKNAISQGIDTKTIALLTNLDEKFIDTLK